MKLLEKKQLKQIKGGIDISGTLLKAFVSTFESILDAGRNIGGSLRRLFSNNICPL